MDPQTIHVRADGRRGSSRRIVRRAIQSFLIAVAWLAAPLLFAQASSGPRTRLPQDGEWLVSDAPADAQQEPEPKAEQAAPAIAPAIPQVTVHGKVLNAATGQPLPRALVKVESGDATGALTDGEGRFEFPGVQLGMQAFDVIKPGFSGAVGPGEYGEYAVPTAHTVRVAQVMPELTFTLAPTNAIWGRITLSNGEPGVGIGITLLRLIIRDGRATWTDAGDHQSTLEGEYRFAGLADGAYTLVTQPEFDNERAIVPACNSSAPAELPGYPIVYYGGAAEGAGASRIDLAVGRQTQANFVLSLSSFHLVQAVLAKVPGDHWQFTTALIDRNGQRLSYPLTDDPKSHTVCTYLPDGAYTLSVEGSLDEEPGQVGPHLTRQPRKPKQVAGILDFTVDSRAKTRVRVPLSAGVRTPIHLRYEPGPPHPRAAAGDEDHSGFEPDPIGLWALRANGTAVGGETQQNSERVEPDLYELSMAAPGAYWIHASSNQAGTCLGAVTAGGVNLAHAPWLVGTLGTGPAIDVVVRTDCAKLTLHLPANLLGELPGEEPMLYVYVVPEFESTQDVRMITARPSTDATVPLDSLTPGDYRVFVFNAPRSLEYRDPAAMDRLAGKGQRVTLSADGNADLLLEAPVQ